MRRKPYRNMAINKLLDVYASAASLHASSTISGDYRITNKQADIVADVYRELRSRGLECQRSLLNLLSHADKGVRGWAAAHALEFAPEDGLPVLESLSTDPGILGHESQMVLEEWRKGTLKFP